MDATDKEVSAPPSCGSSVIELSNTRRPHSSLDGKTPDQAYFNPPMPEAVAA
jgi:putative transposase